MNLTFIKNISKNSFINSIFSYVPKSFIYGKGYNYILNLNKDFFERGKTNEINEILKSKLVVLLKECLLHVPWYRENVNINVDCINKDNVYEILNKFPLLDKKTIMENPLLFINDRYNISKLLYGTSGGSTGQGMAVYKNLNEVGIERAFFMYEWKNFNFDYSKSRVLRFGTEARKGKDDSPCERKGNKLFVSPYHLNERWMKVIIDEIQSFKPSVIHSYPSCVEYLARYINFNKIKLNSVKGIVVASESFSYSQYEIIYKAFQCPISANYGLSERVALAFSEIKDESVNYRFNPLFSFVENVKDEFDNNEIVGTNYWNTVMPLIRYKTQDFATIQDNLAESLDGRKQDLLYTLDNEVIPGVSIKIDEFTWSKIDIYQVVQKVKGELIIKIVPKTVVNDDFVSLLKRKQEERWGDYFNFSIKVVDDIPKTKSGKTRLIICEI